MKERMKRECRLESHGIGRMRGKKNKYQRLQNGEQEKYKERTKNRGR
jgi:hypothetical protein